MPVGQGNGSLPPPGGPLQRLRQLLSGRDGVILTLTAGGIMIALATLTYYIGFDIGDKGNEQVTDRLNLAQDDLKQTNTTVDKLKQQIAQLAKENSRLRRESGDSGTTTTSVPSSSDNSSPGSGSRLPTPVKISADKLASLLLTATDISDVTGLKDVRAVLPDNAVEQLLYPDTDSCSNAPSVKPVEDQFKEYAGAGPYQSRNAGSELLVFKDSTAASTYLSQIKEGSAGCAHERSSDSVDGTDETLRLSYTEETDLERVYLRTNNIVGTVAVKVPGQPAVQADSLSTRLAKHLPR